MLQLPELTGMGDYVVILPQGEYTSGTYTIPGGRTWDDFALIIVSGVAASNQLAARNGVGVAGVIGDTGWVRPIDVGYFDAWHAAIAYNSASSLSVQTFTGVVYMVYGYLKP
jgi:hypothetical protein